MLYYSICHGMRIHCMRPYASLWAYPNLWQNRTSKWPAASAFDEWWWFLMVAHVQCTHNRKQNPFRPERKLSSSKQKQLSRNITWRWLGAAWPGMYLIHHQHTLAPKHIQHSQVHFVWPICFDNRLYRKTSDKLMKRTEKTKNQSPNSTNRMKYITWSRHV